MRITRVVIWLLAGGLFSGATALSAAPAKLSASGSYWGGVEYEGGDTAVNRVSLQAQLKKRWGRALQLDVELGIDASEDRAGLGTTSNYAPLSKPLLRTEHVRGQIERATLRYRHEDFSIILGKQALAWGVLDGLRVADRAGPVRRRDFVLSEQRPERLGRWGVRARSDIGSTSIDVAAFFDNTADQAPTLGSAFFPSAPRSLGGFDGRALATVTEFALADRGHGLAQTTWAMRLARRIGAFDVQLIGLHGPDTEPLIAPLSAREIELRFPTRSLAALSLQRSLGSTVVRFEAAYIPDQSVNLATPGQHDQVGRLLAGVGLDFRILGGWFVNAQLGLDQLEGNAVAYAQPDTQLVATLRAQRSFVQDRLRLKAEFIGSPIDSDGYFGASMAWQVNDSVKAAIGTDLLFGDETDLFGQFENRSRAWIRLTYSP